MLEDLLIISAIFIGSVVAIIVYVSRTLRHPPPPPSKKMSINIEDVPRPLDTSSSVRALKMSEMIEKEEAEVARLLREIEELERDRQA